MKPALLLLAVVACLGINGCASTSPQAESYQRLTQPTGVAATSGSGGAASGPLGAAYDLAVTGIGAAVDPGYLDQPPPQPTFVTDPNPEPYPR